MIRSYRLLLPSREGRCVEQFRLPEISPDSVVLISASEVALAPLPPQEVQLPGIVRAPKHDSVSRIQGRFIGAADISIKNISPGEGVVDFVVFVDFPHSLNIIVDITLLDPPVKTICLN